MILSLRVRACVRASERACVCVCVCSHFLPKQRDLTFSPQIWSKTNLELEIQKTNVAIRISTLKIICMPVFRQKEQLWLFPPKFTKKAFSVWNFEKLIPDTESAPPTYLVCQLSGKMDNFEFFDPNLTKKGFWGRDFEKLCPDAKSAHPRYYLC